jgi:uncharacterized repeat protein (TIGR01451 family)
MNVLREDAETGRARSGRGRGTVRTLERDGVTAFWRRTVAALIVVVCCFGTATPVHAQAPYLLWTGQAAAQTQIDTQHKNSWYITVVSGSFVFGGGNFTMKAGSTATADVTLTIYQGGSTSGTVLGTITRTASAFTGQFTPVPFSFPSNMTLSVGTYYVVLTSTAPDTQSQAFFIKGVTNSIISVDGTTAISPTIASPSSTPDVANLTLSKSGPASVAAGGTVTYTVGLGNDGGSPSGTTATVKDQLPAGVTATAVTAGAGVSSVNCGALPSSSGALLTCTLTLSAALAASAPQGVATFTISATAPASAGTITNYAAVGAAGTSTVAAPGASCATTSCGSVATTVTAPANLTLAKAATAAVVSGGTISYTLNLGNSGGVTSGTSATVADQLPAGVTATAATAGTGVSSVSCTNLNTASALLTCTVTLTSGLAAGAANGTAAFSITATAPATAGSITNYASVGPTGTSTVPAPGASCATTSCGGAATTVAGPANLTLSKAATGSIVIGGTITYTLNLGNSGGATSGTSATVADQLPTGVTATATTAGTGVSSVSCTNLNTASALLTCTVTLTSGMAAGAANGTAAFSITAIAPASVGSITNYASVGPTGTSTVPAPGASCATTSCGSAGTTVTAVAAPANLTLSKAATASVVAGGTISYALNLGNSGGLTSGTSATVADQLPAGVTATAATAGTGVSSVSCTNLNTASALLTCTVTLTTGLAANAPDGTAVFSITATAPASVGSITNYASVGPTGSSTVAAPGASCATPSCGSAATTVAAPANLTLSKTATASVVAGGTVSYTLNLGNSGGVTSGTSATVADQLPAGVTATTATAGTGVSSVSCTNLNTASALLTCTVTLTTGLAANAPDGAAAFTITATAPATAGSLTNYASVDPSGAATPASPGGSCLTTSCGSAGTTVQAPPDLVVASSHSGSFAQAGTGTYAVTVSNSGGSATTAGVIVVDTLPTGLTPTAVSGTGWSCGISGQTVSCSRSDALAGSGSYPAITVTVGVAAGAGSPLSNVVSVSGGGQTDTTNDSDTDSTTITAAADLTLAISHAGSFTQGQTGAIYTLTASNSGGTASGAVTITDTLPNGLTPTAASGSGWSCSVGGQTATCTRSDGLAASSSYPDLTVTVDVAANASGTLTNVGVVSGGGQSNTANDSASDPTTINAAPDLGIAIGRTGTFLPGQTGLYSLTVSNGGASASSGAVTVTQTLPAGVTPASASGSGWACGISGQTVTCTRADALAAGSAYADISVGTSIASTVTGGFSSTATVANAGDLNAANDSATSTVPAPPDLTITTTHTGSFSQGQVGAVYSVTVTNSGSSDTNGTVTVVDTLPAGLTPSAGSGTGWSCGLAGQVVTCTRADALGAGASYSVIDVIVSVDSSASTPLVNAVNVSGGGQGNTSNDSATDSTAITAQAPDLTVGLTHAGNTTQGQNNVTYTGLATNSGGAATSGAVTFNATFATGLAVSSAIGTGWSCSLSGQTVTCLRTDVIAGGASFPAITMLASVSTAAGTPLTNTAAVSGGGQTNTANDTGSDTTIVAQAAPDLSISVSHTDTLTQGDTAATFTAAVSNTGGRATDAAVSLHLTLPAGVTPAAASGSGWTCSLSGQDVTCTRSDALTPGGTYPVVSITGSVSIDAPPTGAVAATVSGGGETNTLNDSTSDAVTIAALGAQLVSGITRVGDFIAGGTSGYSIVVNNPGPAASTGTVTVTDILPAGLAPLSATGAGWSCSIAGQVVTCTRTDGLPAGSSHPPIAIAVAVSPTATGTLVNTVTVSGPASTSRTTDTTTVAPNAVPVLESDVVVANGVFSIGLDGSYTVNVRNTGTGASSGPVNLAITMSEGVSVTSITGAGWTCTMQALLVTCSRADLLAPGSSFPPLVIAVSVTAGSPQPENVTTSIDGGGMPAPRTNRSIVPVSFPEADLTPHITHSGVLPRLQADASFAVDVQNLGPSQTTGTIRLVLAIPTGLRAISATGAGWACVVQAASVECTRDDGLAVKTTYPIDLRVTVDGNASDGLTLTGTVSSDRDPVPANNVVTDSVHVITFAEADFKVGKAVDRPDLRIGDTTQFRLTVKNLSEARLEDVRLSDTLPKGFTFVNGTARILLPVSNVATSALRVSSQSVDKPVSAIPATIEGQTITPVSSPAGLSFAVGRLAGLEGVTLTYYTIVGMDAKPGTQLTRVVGTYQSPLGERMSAASAEVAVTVTGTAFGSAQVIIGRVFDDANGNGWFDKGDHGVGGVRIVLPTGQAATTDRDGLYNLPAVAAGTTTVTIDPVTVPREYTLPRNSDPRQSGWSRLLRTPLGGGALLRQDFVLVRAAVPPAGDVPASSTAPSVSETVSESTDGRVLPLDSMSPRRLVIGRLEIVAERAVLDAGGRDRGFVTIRAFDREGTPLKSGSVTVETTAGQWLLPGASRAASQIDAAALTPVNARPIDPADYCQRDAPAVELPAGLQTGTVTIVEGVARICLQSDVAPGAAQLRAAAGDGSGVEAKTSVRFAIARSTPVLAAVGELSVGRGEPATTSTPASGNVHGAGAMFFQGQVAADAQLTLAWTTAPSINQAAGTDRRFGIDPGDRVYPVFGDSSTRQELAASNARVYARLDVKQSSVLFGDLHGDVARVGRSGLLDISRTLTGTEVRLARNASQWLTLQAARPETAFAREVFPGTAAGYLRLANAPILIGSDTLTLEVRDRRRPDLVRDREPLVRGVDYTLDPLAGIVYFNRPLPLFDDGLNVVQVVCTYEYQASGLRDSVFVARGQQDVASIGLAVHASAMQQTVSRRSDIFVGGVEADQQLPHHGRLHVEVPLSHGVDASGRPSSGIGSALRAELDQPLGGWRRAVIRARLARTDSVFANPYGSPVVPGSTIGSGGIELQATSTSTVRITATGESTHSTAADARRATVSAEWNQKVGDRLDLTGIFDARQLEDARAGRQVGSELVTGAVRWRPSDRIETHVRREQNLGAADPTYPDQTVMSGRYRVTPATQLFATQRWSNAPIIPITGIGAGGLFTPLSTRETAVGIESRLQRFTTLTSRYQIDRGISGTDGLAVLGVLTRVPVGPVWSVDGGLDRAVHVQGSGSGYTSATGGLSFAPEAWRATLHYQFRAGAQSQHLFSTGVAGQLAPSVTALAHYRRADYLLSDTKQTRVDALAALAVRPRSTDRAALLFSWNYGDDLSQILVLNQQPGHRLGRLSADGYFQPARRLELYSRVALLRTDLGNLGSASTYLWQGRAQVAVFSRVDVAGELRWVDELASNTGGRLIDAGEIGFWVSRDLRVGGGYTSRPWTASGPTLETSTGRGGFYFVLSSRLSSLFDLFTRPVNP